MGDFCGAADLCAHPGGNLGSNAAKQALPRSAQGSIADADVNDRSSAGFARVRLISGAPPERPLGLIDRRTRGSLVGLLI